ncbi:MAG: ABC transporter ATP-binding protein [Aestuariivirga sp.]
MLKGILSIFWTAPGGRPFPVVACMLLASLAELTSMGALVPLVAQLSSDTGGQSSFLGRTTTGALGAVGISPTFVNLLLVVGCFLVLKSVIAFMAQRFVAVSVAEVGVRIRTRLLNSMMNARWSYFVDHKPGEVAAMITAQSTTAGDAFNAVSSLVTTCISAFGLLVTASLISLPLVAFCSIAVLALALPLYYILRRARQSSDQQWRAASALTSGIQDVVNNMKPLKSMQRQQTFLQSFARGIQALRNTQVQMVVSRHAIYNGQDILGAVMVLSGVFVSVVYLKTPVSQMLVVGILFYQLVDVIKRIQLSLQDANMAASAYYSVLKTIDYGDSQKEPDSGRDQPTLRKSIRFEKVGFSYGLKKVLDHVDLEIPANKITVLIGTSGSGKTTLIDLIIGFYQPASGRILADNIDLKDIHLSDWRKMIGYVPQELTMLRGSIADNITLGDENITDGDVKKALQLAGALAFVEELPNGIATDIGTMGAKLSGGQRQRISLARALVHKPSLLLLDEVTSALDDASEAEICKNIEALSGALTIVAITHKPAWTLIADRVYRINKGKAVLNKKPKI